LGQVPVVGLADLGLGVDLLSVTVDVGSMELAVATVVDPEQLLAETTSFSGCRLAPLAIGERTKVPKPQPSPVDLLGLAHRDVRIGLAVIGE
jgi:hypothetical protein